jgi:chemotaxis protein CheY-P-specific phosphatase CheC
MRTVAGAAASQAAARLGRLLQTPVQMSTPSISMLLASDLAMTPTVEAQGEVAFCQGYIGGGIAGEALLTLTCADPDRLAGILRFEGVLDATIREELLADIANLIIGACLNGLGDQIDTQFNQTHPCRLNNGAPTGSKRAAPGNDAEMLALETTGSIEGTPMHFNLLLLFTPTSTKTFRHLVAYLQ